MSNAVSGCEVVTESNLRPRLHNPTNSLTNILGSFWICCCYCCFIVVVVGVNVGVVNVVVVNFVVVNVAVVN